jgi:hypothetical protein
MLFDTSLKKEIQKVNSGFFYHNNIHKLIEWFHLRLVLYNSYRVMLLFCSSWYCKLLSCRSVLTHHTWFPEYTSRHKGASSTNGLNNILNMSNSQNGFHSALNALNLNSSISSANGDGFLNSSWSSSPSGNRLTTTHGNCWIGQYWPFILGTVAI